MKMDTLKKLSCDTISGHCKCFKMSYGEGVLDLKPPKMTESIKVTSTHRSSKGSKVFYENIDRLMK